MVVQFENFYMIKIDYFTIQKLILSDLEVQKLLPEFENLFKQWKLGLFAPSLRPTAQKAQLDLLNQLGHDHVRILEQHFKTPVEIIKFDYTIVKNNKVLISELQNQIESLEIKGEMFLHRDANHIYIGHWH